ncbi:putative ABC transport system permease protein [Streptococcus rupicaprae]|uniref:ABC transport system permease protein n=1 Tax=Streptococcus rupicaprae TaxID=759619 RepID=A0ABV2FHD0_9STRE
MNFLKRAWLSVSRRKGKSLLLFAIVFIIANVIAGAISIQQASKRVEEKIKYSMGAIATLEVDGEALQKEYAKDSNFSFDSRITPDIIQQIAQSPYVKYYDYSTTASLGSEELEYFVPEFIKEQEESGSMGGFNTPEQKYYAFSVHGVQYPNILDIEEKKISLVDGRVLTQEEVDSGKHVGLISKQVAELNNIKVGDTVNFGNFEVNYGASGESSESSATLLGEFPIEIVGIFDSKSSEPATKDGADTSQNSPDQFNKAMSEQMQANTIYAPNQLAVDIMQVFFEKSTIIAEQGEEVDTSPYYSPVYVLKRPEDVAKFKEENMPLVPKYYTIMASSDQYDTIAAPVQAMSKMAGYVLWVAILAAILIITLVVLLFLRDRKHELGIYLSFGEQKGKVFGQILVEVLLISFVAVSLAVLTGNLLANSLSGSLIQQQLENQAMNDGGMTYYMFGPLAQTNYTTEDVIAAYKVTLTPLYIVLMYAVGLGTTLLATLAPLAYILRLNPKKIMM